MSLSILILAAGAGTRMKSEKPKVLHSLCGKEMLYYAIREARQLSDDVTVVLYHQKERVEQAMKHYFDDVKFVVQDHENFPGTGGAVMAATFKHEKVLVLNGDMPLVQASELSKLTSTSSTVTMSVLELSNPSGYGRVITQGDHVLRIVEEKDATSEEKNVTRVNAGVYCFSQDFLTHALPKLSNNNAQKEYYLTDVIEMAVKENFNVSWIQVDETNFKGVNSKVDLASAEMIYLERLREKWMKEGVIMHLPHTIYLDDSVIFEGECELETGVVIKGNTLISNSLIKAHSVIEESTIHNSDIGPMARIRPQSIVEGSHIGNFVEIKKSHLHHGVKAGHLAYIGDATVGENVNIGAGVITCNYDGVKKYETIIESDVFIGSDSQLIAPVTLKQGSFIAAGTTVTRTVPEKSLALSRVKQENKEGFVTKKWGK